MSSALSNSKPANAAIEVHDSSAARAAINSMRRNLGRSSAASVYSKLTDQQKAMVLYGAKLRPSEHIRTPFDHFDIEQREMLRRSIMALCDLNARFSKMCSGAILLYEIPKVIIGENQTFLGEETLLKAVARKLSWWILRNALG